MGWIKNPCEVRQVPLHAEYGKKFHIVVDMKGELPKGIVIRCGTIINELRSILDALACSLAEKNGADSVKDVYFPIAKSHHDFKNNKQIKQKIRKISTSDRALIEDLEPWVGGNDLLCAMHWLDVTRKHQRLVIVSHIPSGVVVREGTFSGSVERKIIGGRTVIATLDSISHGKINPSVHLEFSEPDFLKTKKVIASLNEFSRFVSSTIEIFN